MIKLKDLLFERETVFVPKDKKRDIPPYRFYFRVLKPFSAEILTGVWDKTNQYYGNSQVSKQRTERVTVKIRWKVFKNWEPYKTSFEKKTAKR